MRPAIFALLLAGYAAAQGAPAPAPNTTAKPTTTPALNPAPAPTPAQSTPSSQQSPANPPAQSSPAQEQQSVTPSTTVYTGVPTFAFQSMPTATQCATAQVRWGLRNEDPTKYAVNLYVYNEGVDQAVPPPSSSTAAPPAVNTQAANTPAANTPAANTPAANTPAANTPAANTPAANTPAANTPAANANTSNPPAANPAPAASAATPPAPAPAPAKPSTTQAVAGGGAALAPVKRGKRGLRQNNGIDLEIARRDPMPYDTESMHLVARASINSTVVKGWRAHMPHNWVVDVPPGRYRFLAIVNDEAHTWSESLPFTVVDSQNSTCLKQDTADASNTASTASDPAKTSGSAGSANEDGSTSSTKSGLGGGAIAGVVIGVLAGLALAATAFFCLRKASREKRRDAGGREPQTPMRNLISQPKDFRKTKGARGSVGHALAAIGLSRDSNRGADSDRAERGEKPLFPGVPRRRGSNMTTDTADNPFETAPTTPVEEKSLAHTTTPGSSFGTSIPPSSALATGFAGRELTDSRSSHATHQSSGYPPYSPSADAHTSRTSTMPYDAAVLDDDADMYRRSTPTPMRLPPTHLPANLAPSSVGGTTPGGSSVGNMTPGTHTPGPNTPVTAAFTSRASHHSRPSQGSVLEAAGTTAASSSTPNPPPSAFQAQTPGSPGSASKGPDRKNSLRRKPVPRLAPEEVASSPDAGSQGHSSDSGHQSQERFHSASGLRLPETSRVGAGPAGDEYGLNAALASIDRSQNYTLIADPPLSQDDDRRY